MNPILFDIPLRFETQRLVLRCPQAGDGPALHAAVLESLNELQPFPFAFNVLDAKCIVLDIDSRNTRSIAVARRLGFVYEGTLRWEYRNHHTGELADIMYFAKLRADDDNDGTQL